MSHDLKTLANPFQFSDLDIRTATDEHSEVWFCAKDVCAVLDIVWSGSSATLENMPENWLMVWKLQTTKGEKEAVFINEAGLYHLIFRSNKPKAKEFANWVCETVLPEIRKTGFFGAIEIKDQINVAKQIDVLSLQIIQTKNAFRRKLLQDQLRRLCNLVNQPIPPTDWIALEHDQVDLFEANGGAA
jgi:prophage antirepressor-like protein